MSSRKSEQLGMNVSTASGRLVKDLLFKLICDSGINKCFHCGEEMLRENFSVEHKTPWMNSENPVGLFFDLDNVAFSHLSCNVKAARNGRPRIFTEEEAAERIRESKRRHWTPEKRREHYLRTGN